MGLSNGNYVVTKAALGERRRRRCGGGDVVSGVQVVQPHDDEAQATIASTFAGVEPFTVVDTVTFEECDPAAAELIHCASTQGRSTHAPAPSLNGFLRSMPPVPGDPEASG